VFAPGGWVLYIGDTENKFAHLEAEKLAALGVTLDSAAKIPDVIVYHVKKNWLLLIEAVTEQNHGEAVVERADCATGSIAFGLKITARQARAPKHTRQKGVFEIPSTRTYCYAVRGVARQKRHTHSRDAL
jgi:hypothetical protein